MQNKEKVHRFLHQGKPAKWVTGHFTPKSFCLGYLPPILEQGILYLKHACFGLWLKEGGILHFKHSCLLSGL